MGQTAKDKAAGEAARTNAQLAGSLWSESKGPLSEILEMLKSGVGGGADAIPESVSKQFDMARQQNDLGYDSAIRANRELAGARAKTSGQPYSTGELDAAISQGTFALNQSRATATRNLNFQEAQAGMGQYNQMLSLLGQGANTAIGMGQGMTQAQLAGINGMSSSGGWGGAAQGAAGGAGMGAQFTGGNPYGIAIGAVLGGAAGYFG
jgi:hypothetical protein